MSIPTPPPGPTHFGRYAVRRRIGSGGFATVWLAYDEQLDGPVAVKVLADIWSEQHEVRNRFIEEGRYLRRVESAHVVPVYDAGTLDDGRPFLVMAYADQGSLADRLEQGGVTVPQALELVSQVGLGLQALHDRGVLHRDVKPANVLFRTVDPAAGVAGVRAMVGDLGLGKALDVSSRLTMIAGTPAYVAPEQAQGEAPDARADQFSLAVLSYLLLTGRLPWQHATLPAAAAGSESAPLSAPGREFPDRVEQVIRRALAHDPQWRWPSVTSYVDQLSHALDEMDGVAVGSATRMLPIDPALTMPGARPTMAPPDPLFSATSAPPPKPRRRAVRLLACAAVLLVALGAGAVAGFYGEHLVPLDDVTVNDDTFTLSVTVPATWNAVGTDGWLAPNTGEGSPSPAISVGIGASWAQASNGEGAFVGLLPGDELPLLLPQHPDCDSGEPTSRTSELGASVTEVFGCTGGVTVERVVQVSDSQLLWIQVRSADRATANRVLDSVDYGL